MSLTPPHSSLKTEELLDLLTSLVQKSLVVYEEDEQGRGRYRLLETVRQYARGRLSEAGDGAVVRSRHCAFYLEVAERAEVGERGVDQTMWVERLEREHDNMQAALTWCEAEPAGIESELRLAAALRWFWTLRGHIADGQRWLEAALARSADAPVTAQAKALTNAGIIAYFRGDHASLDLSAAQALSLARAADDRRLVLQALTLAQFAADVRGDRNRARESAEEAVALAQELGEPLGLGNALFLLGNYYIYQEGNYEQASRRFEESLLLLRRAGANLGTCYVLTCQCLIAQYRGEYQQARGLAEEALAIAVELNARTVMPACLECLAGVTIAAGVPARAARLLGAAEALREAVGAPVEPQDRDQHQRWVATARSGLPGEAFATAWAQGRAMSLEEAVMYALTHADVAIQQ